MSRFVKSRYEFNQTWRELRETLAKLQTSDARAEAKVSKGKSLGCYGGFLCFVGTFAICYVFKVGALLFLAGVVLFVYGATVRGSGEAGDLENMRYELPLKLLDSLAVDLDPDKNVHLVLDFRDSQSPKFVQSVEQSKLLFISYGPKVTRFSHDWLEMSATTVKGHRLKLQINRQGTYKQIPKRKRTKTRLRYADSVALAVRPSSEEILPTEATGIELPVRHCFRNLRAQLGPQGAVIKAAGPAYWTASNRGTSSGGTHLEARDLIVLLITAFRALLRCRPAPR